MPIARPTSKAAYRLMLAFMLTTVLAPTILLNKILFAILIAWTFRIFVRYRSPRPELVMPVFAVVGIFLYGLVVSIPADNDHALAIQFFLAVFVLFLVHFVEHFRIDMDRASEICGRTMVAVTIVYAILVQNPGLPFASILVEWFDEISLTANAERDFLESATSTLALGTAPFLFVSLCVVAIRLFQRFRASDLVWLLLYSTTIVVSGARGVIVVGLAFLVLAALRLAAPLVRLLVVILAAFAFFIIIPEILASTNIFSDEEVSNLGKIGHFESFIEALNLNNGLFGNGLGSYYYSMGKGAMTQHTELTPIDMARYVGIPLAIVFFAILLIPRLKLLRIKGSEFVYTVAFSLYLVLSVTNPVLINSYGMLVVIWYWTKLPSAALPKTVHPVRKSNVDIGLGGSNAVKYRDVVH